MPARRRLARNQNDQQQNVKLFSRRPLRLVEGCPGAINQRWGV